MQEDMKQRLDTIATERLARIDEHRAALLEMPALTRAHKKIPNPRWTTPEEIILRAWVDETDRDELVEHLGGIRYTYPTYATFPAEGKTAATWDLVRQARMSGFITGEEFERVEAEVQRRLINHFMVEAERVWPGNRAKTWMATRNSYLGGARPLDVLRQGHLDLVLEAFDAEDQGALR